MSQGRPRNPLRLWIPPERPRFGPMCPPMVRKVARCTPLETMIESAGFKLGAKPAAVLIRETYWG